MIFASLKKYFNSGHERSIAIKKNLILLILFKGANLVVSFFMVPLMLHYFTPSKYGIWVTITSIIGWFSFFDIGLGNGLRNRFAEAQAKQDSLLVKTYVSTTYVLISGISITLFVLFMVINPLLNWQSILNTKEISSTELSILALILFFFFCIRFIVDLISTILTADQKPAMTSFLGFIVNVLSFAGLSVLTVTSFGNLILAGTLLSGIPIMVLLFGSVILFLTKYKTIAPSFSFYKIEYARSLTSIGFQFFILQIVTIVMFTTTNIIITQLFGPASVTPYNIAQKYFGLASMSFTIILTPFWSAYTEAYQKNDIPWIKSMTKKLLQAWGVLFFTILFMVIFAPFVYKLWIGDTIEISFTVNVFVALFALISTWNNIFVYFINGVGKIKMQLYVAVSIGVINIPFAIFLGKFMGMGVSGVIASNVICLSIGAIWAPMQYIRIIAGTAKGIWNK